MPKRYTPNDKLSRQAADEGYRARSVYKLKELDTKFKLLKSGMKVLDLGAAPGSWLQYASEKIGPKGMAVGIDLQPIEAIADNVETFECDITKPESLNKIFDQLSVTSFDLIISDLAPKTSGIRDVDQWQSIELSQAVLEVADKWLKPKGVGVIKVLRGADFDEWLKEVKSNWELVKVFTAKASRDRSTEVYVVFKKRVS